MPGVPPLCPFEDLRTHFKETLPGQQISDLKIVSAL